ncbi:2844_t:CDS:1, partial [Gigaspora margarita]
ENANINCLQLKRARLIEWLLYQNSVEDLLVTWLKNICQMALDSVPLKKNAQWFVTWSTNLESQLNNYKCAGGWFNDFQLLALDDIKVEVQRLVAYMLLEKTIKITFQQVQGRQYHNQLFPNCTESWTIPKKIIDLEPAEASKFQYIVGWTIYKLTKSNTSTLAYKEFAKIKSYLDALSSEHVEYVHSTYSKTTTVIPGDDFIQFMYYLEFFILQLFEKHIEYGSDILIYINNNLVNN